MWKKINDILVNIDNFVWGIPLMVLILAGGILLTVRLGVMQFRKLPLALKWMVKNEEGGEGEISSFSALCTALSATIGTGNIVGVATAVGAGGPGALFWMIVAAFLTFPTFALATSELPLMYLGIFITLLLAGPGKCSIDYLLDKAYNRK